MSFYFQFKDAAQKYAAKLRYILDGDSLAIFWKDSPESSADSKFAATFSLAIGLMLTPLINGNPDGSSPFMPDTYSFWAMGLTS